jgi:spore germination protein
MTSGVLSDRGISSRARYEVGVWYPGWGTSGTSEYESVSENLDTIHKVSPYWYSLAPNGSVAAYGWAEDPKLLSLARSEDKPVAPLVTNEFDPTRVGRMLATRPSRDTHAEDLTNLIVRGGYAGLDLDYEMLRAEDRDVFSLFVEDLASRLHDQGKKLSIAVHPKTSEPGTWDGPKAQDWERLGRAVDEFEVMTYDYHWNGSEAGPASPPRWISQVLGFAVTRVDSRKLRMGLPFYGRDWRGTEAVDRVYTEVRDLADRYSVSVHRDPSGEPYYEYPEGHTVFYQDHRSIGAKLDVLVREHPKVGGVAVWHVGGEDQRYWDTIRSKLGRGLGRHRRRTRSP